MNTTILMLSENQPVGVLFYMRQAVFIRESVLSKTPKNARTFAMFQFGRFIDHLYIHADIKMKEQGMAKTKSVSVSIGRYRPNNELLAFLEAL